MKNIIQSITQQSLTAYQQCKILLFLLVSLLFFSSCEDVIDVELEQGETLLVVDGTITDQPGPYLIKLNYTSAYFSNQEPPKVSGASVVISDSEGFTENLIEVEPGLYKTQNIQGKVGNTYTLKIVLNGESYQAETEIKRVPPIDSLTYEYKEETLAQDEGVYVYYYGPEFPGVGDFYRVKVYRNKRLLNDPDELIFQNDKFVDGNYLGDLELNFGRPLNIADTVKVELLSLTEDAYYFYQELFFQTTSQGIFSAPPANVRTNVFNLNPTSAKKAVGYFGGAGISTIEGILQEEKGVVK